MGAGASSASRCCCIRKGQHLSDIQGEPINLQEEFEKFSEQDYLLNAESDGEVSTTPPKKEKPKRVKRDYK